LMMRTIQRFGGKISKMDKWPITFRSSGVRRKDSSVVAKGLPISFDNSLTYHFSRIRNDERPFMIVGNCTVVCVTWLYSRLRLEVPYSRAELQLKNLAFVSPHLKSQLWRQV
jgi:hypothetical protein